MKKLFKLTIAFAVVAIACIAALTLTSSKNIVHTEPKGKVHGNTTEELRSLQAMGFKNVQNLDLGENYDLALNPEKVAYWKDKFNVQFIGSEGIQQYLKQYNLILGKAEDFRGEIPSDKIKEMNEAIKKITPAPEQSLYFINNSVLGSNGVFEYIPEKNIKPEAKFNLDHGAWNNCDGCEIVYLGGNVYKDTYTEKYPGHGLILLLPLS